MSSIQEALASFFEGVATAWNLVRAARSAIEEAYTDGEIVGAQRQIYSGHTSLHDVQGVLPEHHELINARIVYVNGILNDLDTQHKSLHDIAEATGAEVIGVHNGTGGTVADIAQCAADKLDLLDNRAVDTLARVIEDAVRHSEVLNIFAHSHGALCTSRALNHAINDLERAGMNHHEILDRLANIHVQTFGGAAMTYPDGPQYVHHINTTDGVAAEFGYEHRLGFDFTKAVDRVAKVDEFLDNRGPTGSHALDPVYLDHVEKSAIVEERVAGEIISHHYKSTHAEASLTVPDSWNSHVEARNLGGYLTGPDHQHTYSQNNFGISEGGTDHNSPKID